MGKHMSKKTMTAQGRSVLMAAFLLGLTMMTSGQALAKGDDTAVSFDRKLWDWIQELKTSKYSWVDLNHMVTAKTPHLPAMPDLAEVDFIELKEGEADILVKKYEVVSQYGTHVDAPYHFVKKGKRLHELENKSMIMPLCVIDMTHKMKETYDFTFSVDDILNWERVNGKIPAGSFVAIRTDYWLDRKPEDIRNQDKDDKAHYPGWALDALKLLVEERKVGALGHEQPDTDAPYLNKGYQCQIYVSQQNIHQIEMLTNLDKVPATGALIVSSWPQLKDGVGFTARVFAIFDNK